MNGSRSIQVVKRDGDLEPFSLGKLRGCLLRALTCTPNGQAIVEPIARAIQLHLHKRKLTFISSRMLLTLVLRALRHTGNESAAERLEAHHSRRQQRRAAVHIVGPTGRRTGWDKSAFAKIIHRRWDVSPAAARAMAAGVEQDVLAAGKDLTELELIDLADDRVEQFGLAPWCLLTNAAF